MIYLLAVLQLGCVSLLVLVFHDVSTYGYWPGWIPILLRVTAAVLISCATLLVDVGMQIALDSHARLEED